MTQVSPHPLANPQCVLGGPTHGDRAVTTEKPQTCNLVRNLVRELVRSSLRESVSRKLEAQRVLCADRAAAA